MTPGELRLMNAAIDAAVEARVDAAVDAATTPLRREIAELRGVDRRHSLAANALKTDVRQSKSDVVGHVDDTVTALARRDAQLVAALNEIRDRVDANPAAQAADGARIEAAKAGIDIQLVKHDTARAVSWWRHPGLPMLLYAAIEAVWKMYQSSGHGP